MRIFDQRFFVFLLFAVVFYSKTTAQMSGSFSVGSGGDYATISEAIADINSQGLSGDITLTISAGTYAERIDLSNLNNGAFTVTLEGETKQTTIISPPDQDAALIKAGIVMQATHNVTLRNLTYNMSEITDNPSVSPQNIYGIYMEDASNITLDETIVINSTVTGNKYEISSSVYLYNINNVSISANQFEGALYHIEFDYFTDLTISGNTFENASTHIRYFQGELSGGNRTPGNNLTVENNTFTGAFNGIQTSAGSDPSPSNLTMENNEFNYQEANAIRIAGYDAVDIVGNTITSDISGMNPMQISFLSGSEISNNVIETSEGGGGLDLYRSDDIQIYNNIVSSKGFPLELADMKNSEVIHNTFHRNGNNTLRLTVAWIYEGSNNLTLKNNIFSGPAMEMGDVENVAIDFLGNHVNLEQDHNLFDADLGIVVYGASNQTFINGTSIFHEDYDLSELSAWSARVSLDQHSQSLSPVFLDEIDFRIGNGDFRFGTFLSDYSTDIDGETRLEDFVDVGADQYCITIENTEAVSECESYEFAGLTLTESGEYVGEFVATNGCDSLVTLQLTILEPTAGSDDITAEGSYNWNGIIYSASGTYEQTLINQVGCDSVATLNLFIEPYFLEGNFVIGSSEEADFVNFTEAIADLQYATLTGDVMYSVEVGTYHDTLKISNINNGDFSIIFSGEDKATTILHPLDSIDESSSGILIDGTNHVTIQNLTFEMDDISDVSVSQNSIDTKGISVIDSDNITIDNLDLKNNSETSIYNSLTFYIATTLYANNVNELAISNCTFSGAASHITLGDHSNIDILENTFQVARNVIRNTTGGNNLLVELNDFSGPFRSVINLEEVDDVSILSNAIEGIDQVETWESIYLDIINNATIESNTISNVELGIYVRDGNIVAIGQNKVFSTLEEAFYVRDGEDITVTNNFFGGLVYVREPMTVDFVNNTVVCSSSKNRAVLIDYPNSLSGVNHSFVNNILVGGNEIETLVEIYNLSDPSVLTLNHNLYYLDDESGSKPLFTYEVVVGEDNVVTPYATLTEWRDAFSFDQHSQSFAPVFVDTDDFHISSEVDYRFGAFLSDHTLDIDGHLRVESVGVDVGADQNCDPCTLVWDGAWSNEIGPTGSDQAILVESYMTAEDGSFECNNLSVKSEALLQIAVDTHVDILGDVDCSGQISVLSGGSYLTYDGHTHTGNDVRVQRNTHYSDGKYSFVGSPVEQDAAVTATTLGSSVYQYDETQPYATNDGLDRWQPASGTLIPGKGYTQAFQQEILFIGKPNVGTITYSGTYTEDTNDASEGWNLVANPYTAAINVGDFLTANNTTGGVYIWDDNGSDTGRGTSADYIVANGTVATSTQSDPDANRYNQHLGSAQGFFVKLMDNTNTSIIFTEAMRSTGDNADDNFFRKENETPSYIRINLTADDGLFKQAIVGWMDDVYDEEVDRRFDAQVFNKSAEYAIYTFKANTALAIQGATLEKQEIPLGFNVAEYGTYQLEIDQNDFAGSELFLIDRLTNETIDLMSGNYSFHTEEGQFEDRFMLSTKAVAPLSNLSDRLSGVYAFDKTLNIKADDSEAKAYVLYSLSGRAIKVFKVSGDLQINLSYLPDGVYLVSDGEKAKKIILKQ
ncbi:MAG: right-handed parallel beta-helix repeat-containing protein [Cyclobacteriaceae bacterium]